MLRPASKNRCGSRAYGSSARFALATDRRGFLPEDGDFEGWIGAAESGGNPKINHFDNASIPIQDDVARIDIFMNDISMDSAQNLCQFDCKL